MHRTSHVRRRAGRGALLPGVGLLLAITAAGPGEVARAQAVNPPPPPRSAYVDGAAVFGATPPQVVHRSVPDGGDGGTAREPHGG